MEKRTCLFASTNIDGDQSLCLDRIYICRPTYATNGSCVCLCHLSVVKRINNTPLPAALFNPKPDAYLIKNLAANHNLPDIPNDFELSQILFAQHIREPVPKLIAAGKPVTLSTILEKVTESAEASTSNSPDKTAPAEIDLTEKQNSPAKDQVDKDKPTDKEAASTPSAAKRLKLQRQILVDGFQVEKQFRLPTQAVPYGLVYNNWHRSLPTPFKRLGNFLETVPPTNLPYFHRIAPRKTKNFVT